MSILAWGGHFNLNTEIGQQRVLRDDWRWTPKIILFWPTMIATGVVKVNAQLGFGAAIDASTRFAITGNSENGQATSDCTRAELDTACIQLLDPGTTAPLVEADFVSMDIGGFVIDIKTAPTTRTLVNFLALGGSDLEVAIGNFAAKGAVGSDSFTGAGFQPEAFLFATTRSIGALPNAGNDCIFGLGSTSGVGAEGAVVVTASDAAAAADTKRAQRDDRCILSMGTGGGAGSVDDAILESFDADGGTVDWQSSSGNAIVVHWIALKGGQFLSTSFASQGAEGEFSVTGIGFQPRACIFNSFCNAETDARLDHLELSMGMSVGLTIGGASRRSVAGAVSEDAADPTNDDQFFDIGSIYQNYDELQAIEGDIDFVSWDPDGVTLDETVADASTNEILSFYISDPVGKDLTRNAGINYNMRVTDDIKRITETSTGRIVPPEEVRPNNWMKVPDVFTTSLSSNLDIARDPQISFVESVNFREGAGVTINTSLGRDPNVIMAEVGSGSTPAI